MYLAFTLELGPTKKRFIACKTAAFHKLTLKESEQKITFTD